MFLKSFMILKYKSNSFIILNILREEKSGKNK